MQDSYKQLSTYPISLFARIFHVKWLIARAFQISKPLFKGFQELCNHCKYELTNHVFTVKTISTTACSLNN